jgi:hypothetical protein
MNWIIIFIYRIFFIFFISHPTIAQFQAILSRDILQRIDNDILKSSFWNNQYILLDYFVDFLNCLQLHCKPFKIILDINFSSSWWIQLTSKRKKKSKTRISLMSVWFKFWYIFRHLNYSSVVKNMMKMPTSHPYIVLPNLWLYVTFLHGLICSIINFK